MTGPASRSRRWKLWGSLGCAVGLLAALWFGPRMVDWSPFKPEIAAFMSNELGVKVDLRGPLRIELLPQPRITAADIRVSGETANGHIRWLRGSLNPRALLTGRMQPRDVELVEADLTLPFMQNEATPYTGRTSVDVQDGRLTLTGGPTWLPDTVEQIDGRLALGTGNGRLFGFDGEARLSGEPIGIAVEGDGRGGLVLTLAHGPSASDLVLDGAPTEDGGWSGTVTLILEEAGFLSTLNAEAVTRLIGDGAATVDATVTVSPAGIVSIGAERIDTKRLTGKATATIVPGPRNAFDLAVALKRADFTDTPPTPAWIARDLSKALDDFSGIDVTARVLADRIDTPGGALRQLQIVLAAGGGLAVIENASAILPGETDISLFGSLRPDQTGWVVDGEVAVVSPDVRSALVAFYPDAMAPLEALPKDRLRSVDVSARVYADGEGLEITELYGRVDETSWAGALSARTDQGVDLLLQGDRLNLDRHVPQGSGAAKLGLGLLAALPPTTAGSNHRLSLSVDQATVSGVRIDGAGAELSYRAADRLQGTLRAASLASATATGTFEVDLANAALPADLSLRLETPTPDRFLGALGMPARQAARMASLGETTVTLDVSGNPKVGFGYAVEALGSGGDARISGLFEPGPQPVLEITKGALNLGDISLFHIEARCTGAEGSIWHCSGLSAETPGMRFTGALRLDGTPSTRQVDLTVMAMDLDIGLFAARSGFPVLPEGEIRLSGSIAGQGRSLFSALATASGDLAISGDVSLNVRRGGGGKFGNFDTLRTRLRESFGTASPLTGTVQIAPDTLDADLQLDGNGAAVTGKIGVSRSRDALQASLFVYGHGTPDPLLELIANGPTGAPDVRLKGPWITGR